jgi:hypothetical protein
LVLSLLIGPADAGAQATIKVNDDVNIRFGVLFQPWADWTKDPVSSGYSQNVFLRRVRLIVGGSVAKNVTFFIETDNPNLGRAAPTKSLNTGFIVQDALAEVKLADEFIVSAGLMYVPFCRNCVQSAATLLSLDYSSWSFLANAATQSSNGRDIGIQAKGYLNGNRFEYRVGAFQGYREPVGGGPPPAAGSRNPLRAVARVQYNFLDPEMPGIFYTGTYLGTKKVFAIGAGIDAQGGTNDNYQGVAVDAFLDYPLTKTTSLTAQADIFRYDGQDAFGGPVAALAKQNAVFVEAGLFLKQWRLMPFLKYETQSFSETADEPRNQARYQLGLTKYVNGHNANFKGAWSRIDPKTGDPTDALTFQMQVFYY